MTTQQKKSSTRHGFKTGESIVYPAHGVGQIVAIEEQEVAGMKLELFVIDFEKDKMRLKVPVAKAMSIGMRKLSETDFVERALKVVQGKARVAGVEGMRRGHVDDVDVRVGDQRLVAGMRVLDRMFAREGVRGVLAAGSDSADHTAGGVQVGREDAGYPTRSKNPPPHRRSGHGASVPF